MVFLDSLTGGGEAGATFGAADERVSDSCWVVGRFVGDVSQHRVISRHRLSSSPGADVGRGGRLFFSTITVKRTASGVMAKGGTPAKT